MKDEKIYVETMRKGMDVEGLDRIYKVTTLTKDCVNPTSDGNLSW